MTVLSAQSIRRYCATHAMIAPYHDRETCGGMTFGLGPAGYDVRIDDGLKIPPAGFALASTRERLVLPTDILAIVHDKSTWARQGITLQNTVIDPGFRGWVTLEITNHSQYHVKIEAAQPIAQLIFHRLDEVTEAPYAGKYQDQHAGPQPALFER